MIDGQKLGEELRSMLKALFGLAEPPPPKPPPVEVYTVSVSWDPPKPKEHRK